VELRTGAAVTRIEPGMVHVGDEPIRAETVFWAAGNAASPLGKCLGVKLDRVGRVPVGKDLSVPGLPNVFVVGDLASFIQDDGTPVPAVAPAANQMGARAAKNVIAMLKGETGEKFSYFDKGNLATIGRNRAIADWGKFRLTGFVAWVFWLFVHIMYLVGFRNRLSVLLSWAYSYFTAQRGVRLITSAERTHQHPREEPGHLD
jgi:NADH:ubiquinone reductase (H+-translocating)